MERLSVEDLLLVAETALGVPAEQLACVARLATAAAALAAPAALDRGRPRHPALADKAAVLCVRLVRDRPVPRGNGAVALLATLELVERNHGVWTPPAGGQDETAATIERLAAGELSDAAFTAWVRARVREPSA
jgi:prophage maintenance system killer protein